MSFILQAQLVDLLVGFNIFSSYALKNDARAVLIPMRSSNVLPWQAFFQQFIIPAIDRTTACRFAMKGVREVKPTLQCLRMSIFRVELGVISRPLPFPGGNWEQIHDNSRSSQARVGTELGDIVKSGPHLDFQKSVSVDHT